MILTCPECATSYFVDDSRVPAQGRRVRCSSCGHRWTAGPDGPIPDYPPVVAQPVVEPEPEPDFAAEPVVAPEPEEVEPPPPIRPPPPRASGRAARAEGRSNVMVWAGAAALAVALIAGALIFREQVVRLWPESSAAYAGLGFDMPGAGLVLEQVQVQPAFLAGRPVLAVTGAIRNVRDVPVEAPPVRLTLLNRAGQPVAAKIARPDDARIPPKTKRHFSVTMLDPPATARELEVRFDGAAHAKAAPRAAEAVLTPTPALPRAAAPPAAKAAEPGDHPIDTTPPAEPAELSPAAAVEHG